MKWLVVIDLLMSLLGKIPACRRQGRRKSPFVGGLCRGEVGSGNLAKQIFQEVYPGAGRFAATYGIPPRVHTGKGCLQRERLLAPSRPGPRPLCPAALFPAGACGGASRIRSCSMRWPRDSTTCRRPCARLKSAAVHRVFFLDKPILCDDNPPRRRR